MAAAHDRGMCRAAMLAAALATILAGCGAPLEAYRSARGLDKEDPGPNAPYTRNLAAGEIEDYPNLATVPPPPTRASTAAERAALTKKLIAERTTAEAEAGPLMPAPAAAPAVVAAPTRLANAAPEAGAGPEAIATTMPGSRSAAQPAAARRGRQPTEAPPLESSLQMPTIPAVPEPEATRPPPPPARVGPAPAIGANDLPAVAKTIETPAAPPPLPAVAPPPVIAAAMPEPRRLPQALPAIALQLPDPPQLAPEERARLDQIAAAYRSKPGIVKIVGYAAPGPAGPDQLASFRAALDRAQFVAGALAQAGVPRDKIQTEASPARAGAAAGRVEVRLAP